MADLYNDGSIAAWWVAAIADISAPKAATEIGAVSTLKLHERLAPDGLKTPADTAEIKTSKLFSTFTTNDVGRRGFTPSLKYVRGDAVGEQLYDTVLIYRAAGFLVVRRNLAASAAPAAAQKVEVYPCRCKEPVYDDPTENSMQMVTVGLTLTGEPRSVSNPAILAA